MDRGGPSSPDPVAHQAGEDLPGGEWLDAFASSGRTFPLAGPFVRLVASEFNARSVTGQANLYNFITVLE
jgi:hypothetical protein